MTCEGCVFIVCDPSSVDIIRVTNVCRKCIRFKGTYHSGEVLDMYIRR